MLKTTNVPYNIKVSLNSAKTNFKQKLMIIKTKPSQRRGGCAPRPHIWDSLSDIGTPFWKISPYTPVMVIT